MIDLERLKGVEVDQLESDDVDYWCTKLLGFSPNANETKPNLLTLFEFTRSLLNLKLTQNDVLVEELKTLGEKFDALGDDIESIKQTPSEKENELEDAIQDERMQNKLLEDRLKLKDNEIGSLRIEVETLRRTRKDYPDDQNHDDIRPDDDDNQTRKSAFQQKNAEIEQLLDRVYEADRQNLNLAESLAKAKLDNAKYDNQEKIHLSRIDLLELENKEYKKLNESLFHERQDKNHEIDELKQKLENILQNNHDKNGDFSGLENESNLPPEKRSSLLIRENLYNELKSEIERLTVLLEVKDSQLERAQLSGNYRNQTDVQRELEKKQLEIENLEEELSILSSTNESSDSNDKQKARILSLKKDKHALMLKISELEKEAGNKDEELENFRRRQSGGATARNLMEENAVLGKMLKTRDEKISHLIEQLNRNSLANLQGHVHPENLKLEDKLTALSVERDILDRQIATLGAHLESVQKENFELEAGLREILVALRNSDTSSDVVIECPSLEKLCSLMENRLLSSGAFSGTEIPEFGKIILLKTELDNVRGQNEQLRAEIKQLRNDFLSVIDGYTNDILENWTISRMDASQSSSKDGTAKLKPKAVQINDEEEATLEQVSEIRDDPAHRTFQVPDSNTNDEVTRKETEINMEILKKLKSIQARQQSPRRTPRMKLNLRKNKKIINQTQNKQEPLKDVKIDDKIDILEKANKDTQTDEDNEDLDKELRIKLENLKKKEEEINDKNEEIDEISEKNMRLESNRMQLQELKTELAERERELNDLKSMLEKKQDLSEAEHVQTTNNQQTQTKTLQTSSLATQVSFEKEEEYSPPKKIENDNKRIDKEDEEEQESDYVEMIDNSTQTDPEAAPRQVQTIRKTQTISAATQTKQIVQEFECSNCDKYVQSFQTIKNLIQSERQQFNQINARNQEHIDKLKQTLTVTKQEYEFDVRSKNNVIKDLRNKLKQNNSTTELDQTDKKEDKMRLVKTKNNVQDDLAVVPHKADPTKDVSKTILETSILCLRNCLKQKEDALEEYRKLVEEMRASVQKSQVQSISREEQNNLQVSLTKNEHFGQNLQELMLKPYVQQNEELNSLIQKTFQELRIVRESNAKQHHSMKLELESKGKILIELTKKHENDRKEKEYLKQEIKSGLEREKTLLAKIEKLNARITELSKRTLRQQQKPEQNTGSTLKKDEISAEHEKQINTELQNQIKKLEVERWTIEKKHEQDKQHWRQTMEDREKSNASTEQQLSKSQALIGKLEKQLRNARSSHPKPLAVPVNNVLKTLQHSRSIQTEPIKSVRFEEKTSSQPSDDLLKQYEILNEELQRQLEASLKREKFSTVIKEVQAVGENILETTRIDRIHEPVAENSEHPEKRSMTECYVWKDKRTNILKPSEIYDQLIDMQFDRLVSENAHLKVQLRLRDEADQFHALLE